MATVERPALGAPLTRVEGREKVTGAELKLVTPT